MTERNRASPSGTGGRTDPPATSADPYVRYCLVVLAALAVFAAANEAKAVLVPVTFAVVFAAILAPLAAALRRLRLPAFVAAGIAVLTPFLLIGMTVQLLLPSLDVWQRRLPLFIRSVELKLDGLTRSLDDARDMARRVQQIAAEETEAIQVTMQDDAGLSFLWDIPVFVTSATVSLILTLFFLTVAPAQMRRLSRGEPFESRLSRTLAVNGRRLIQDIARYYRTVFVVNVCLGIIVWIAMMLLDMPQPYLWGIIAGLVNFVPYAGPVVGTGIIAVASLISFDTALAIALPPLVYVALTAMEGYFITPTLVGRTLTLNPLMVLLSVVFWGWMWGIGGAFLAVPMLVFLLRAAKLPRLIASHPARQPESAAADRTA